MNQFDNLPTIWEEYVNNPIISPPFPSPVIADPTFLPPEQTHDGLWHLFAHVALYGFSLFNIIHFVSRDGIKWNRLDGIVSRSSLRPFLFRQQGKYYLAYEKLIKFLPDYYSQIEIRSSLDLMTWSEPKTILTPSLSWHKEGTKLGSISNPCIVSHKDSFRLYYSGGLVYLEDCKFSEPKYIGCAESNNVLGPYISRDYPVLKPSINDPYVNLGAGSIKVINLGGVYVGFQNGIYWDNKKSHSGSSIRMWSSDDGINWKLVSNIPIIEPGEGWKRSYVYANDVRITEKGWVMYFNARNGWFIGSEKIGQARGYTTPRSAI